MKITKETYVSDILKKYGDIVNVWDQYLTSSALSNY